MSYILEKWGINDQDLTRIQPSAKDNSNRKKGKETIIYFNEIRGLKVYLRWHDISKSQILWDGF